MSWKIIESYYEHYDLTSVHIQSYNHFILNQLCSSIQQQSMLVSCNSNRTVQIEFFNVYCDNPMSSNRTPLYPTDARKRDLTYDTSVFSDIRVMIIDSNNIIFQSTVLSRVELFRVPVMVGSCLCNTQTTNDLKNEDQYNNGGYFIVKGHERVIVAQERINYNQVYIYKQKQKYKYIAEIRSIKEGADYSVLFQMKLLPLDMIVCSIPYISKDIPLYVLFTVMQIDPKFVFSYVKHDKHLYLIIKQHYDLYGDMTYDACIQFLGQFISNKVGEKREQYIRQIITYEVLPHFSIITDVRIKAVFIIQMVQKLIATDRGERKEDDRDHICNKRIETTGELLHNLVHGLFKKFVKQISQYIEKREAFNRIEDLNLIQLFNRHCISQRILYCFSTGNWGIPNSTYIRQGVSQVLNRQSYIGMVSHLQRIVVPIGKESRNTQVRQIHSSNYGFIDPVETPEGQTVGIIKNFSIMTRVSTDIPTVYIIDLIKRLFPDYPLTFKLFNSYCCVYINGLWIGSLKQTQVDSFIQKFRDARTMRIIPSSVSIGWNSIDSEICIYSDAGRALRPVIRTDKLKELNELVETKSIKELWPLLIDADIICYIDGNEAESSFIQMNISDEKCDHDLPFEYTEIHPCLMLGVCSNMTPFPEHSQAPRNVYVAAMMKQAIGMYSYAYQQRCDTIAHVLNYPQRKLVSTKMSEICHMEEMPSGQEAIVAVMCYTGFNQEDSILMNKSAIERGLFGSTSYRTTSTNETKKSTHDSEIIEIPPTELRMTGYNYDLLGEDGIVRKGAIVKKNDVLVGRVHYSKNSPIADCSLVCKSNEEGYVDQVIQSVNAQGYKLVKVRICALCIPEIGDKFCQISAQKGTIGMIYNQEDMPFTSEGLVPDIIINPHAFPSRMTINMLMEMLAGKVSCFSGKIADSSAFDHDGEKLVEEMGSELVKNGYNCHGTETMYNGFTGEMFRTKIFIGPAYYQRLKHLVASKIHGRNYGSVQLLSRQPCAGRSREGGLRYGEMERDCAIVHGISSFLRERLFNLSDPYSLEICSKCDSVGIAKNTCLNCSNDKTTEVHIPYACKLLFQELQAMAIKIQIHPTQ